MGTSDNLATALREYLAADDALGTTDHDDTPAEMDAAIHRLRMAKETARKALADHEAGK